MKTPHEDILERTLNNEATPEDARIVVAWLATPEGQEWLSDRMDKHMENIQEGSEEQYIDHPIPSAEILSRLMKSIRRQKIRKIVFRAAAVIIPLILFSGLFLELDSRVDLFAESGYDEIYVPRGERMQVMLQDGSKVLLNSESRIRFPKKFGLNERTVELEGEGWFEVAKQKNRPFIVDAKLLNVRVLGTTFDIKAYPDEAEILVSLESGSVELNGKTFRTVLMEPGQKAIYNRSSGKCTLVRPENIHSSSAWKESQLLFNNAPLSEILKMLERNFDVKFVIENPELLKYTIVLETKFNNLSLILDELETIAPVKFEQKERIIRVTEDTKR